MMSCHLSFETLKIFLLTTVSHRNNVDDINTYIHTYSHFKIQSKTEEKHTIDSCRFCHNFFSIFMLFTETITHFTACYWRNLQREPQNDLSLGKNPGEICKSYLPGFASNLRASKHLPCFKFCLSGTSLGWKGLYGHNFLRLKSHCYSNFSGKISKNWSCA